LAAAVLVQQILEPMVVIQYLALLPQLAVD
jgi:hypothetical protein